MFSDCCEILLHKCITFIDRAKLEKITDKLPVYALIVCLIQKLCVLFITDKIAFQKPGLFLLL